MVGVSLPSLRLDSFSVELADIVAGVRRTDSPCAQLRHPDCARINKWIPDEVALHVSKAYQLGWDHETVFYDWASN